LATHFCAPTDLASRHATHRSRDCRRVLLSRPQSRQQESARLSRARRLRTILRARRAGAGAIGIADPCGLPHAESRASGVRPVHSDDLARWMHWTFTTHVRWYHAKYSTTGRVWQGRFKAFIVQEDHHLLTVMRYVERNALRANLVERAEDWEWGSLAWRRSARPPVELAASPVSLPSYWRHLVNDAQTAAELDAIRACVNRQRPFGAPDWVSNQIAELVLQSSITPVGRPPRSRRVPIC